MDLEAVKLVKLDRGVVGRGEQHPRPPGRGRASTQHVPCARCGVFSTNPSVLCPISVRNIDLHVFFSSVILLTFQHGMLNSLNRTPVTNLTYFAAGLDHLQFFHSHPHTGCALAQKDPLPGFLYTMPSCWRTSYDRQPLFINNLSKQWVLRKHISQYDSSQQIVGQLVSPHWVAVLPQKNSYV